LKLLAKQVQTPASLGIQDLSPTQRMTSDTLKDGKQPQSNQHAALPLTALKV
jgi:hypothetical protein